jgi:predicted nucleotidyltransferase
MRERAIFARLAGMKSDEVIAVLRQHESMLRARGIIHAALFGSLARGEARPDSDIDVMIEIDPRLQIGLFEYAGLKRIVEELLGFQVDVVNREAMKPYVRTTALRDAIQAF